MRVTFVTPLYYFFLCLFFLSRFFRLWVAILCLFLFLPQGITNAFNVNNSFSSIYFFQIGIHGGLNLRTLIQFFYNFELLFRFFKITGFTIA